MAKLQKVIITKKIIRPYGGVSEPQVGMTGHIVEESDTPANHTCIRFLSETLGYSYDPEYDDADRKYIRVYVPNNNFEVVTAKKSNTAKETKASQPEQMKQPQIMMNIANKWHVMPGHDCNTQEEMEEYVQLLDPSGKLLKVAELAIEAKPRKKM